MMAKLAKIALYLVVGMAGMFVIGAIALKLFFDPNDFRDEISQQVQKTTGRELTIEGELSVSVFPWLAVEIGATTLGNAPGFGTEPFVRFDNASLSIEFMPLVLRQEISIGAVSLDGFEANLAVASDGTTNWDDLGSADETAADQEEAGSTVKSLDIANVRLADASVTYTDAQSGSRYTLTDLTVGTGRIATGEPFDLDVDFSFAATPGELGGSLAIRGRITLAESMQQLSLADLKISGELRGIVSQPTDLNLEARGIDVDMAGQSLTLGEIDLSILGLNMGADVERFSYAGEPAITAALRVSDFSLKDLMRTLDIEAPVTADPNAMTTVSFRGKAQLVGESLSLSDMELVLDDTTMKGTLALPLGEGGLLTFELAADSINLDNYMAPADATVVATETADATDVEIPVELIRALNASGKLRLDEAFLGPMTFTNLELGLESADGRLRLQPITAEFFEGAYNGDVRIDASGATPVLSVNERISGVNLQAMARTVFEAENISGTIEGSFALGGRGATLSQIRADLNGTMSLELADGALEGTDVWHQLRTARALYKREQAPEPVLPPRTEFTAIQATGTVTDGVFANDDLLVEMPFLRITGNGTIDLNSTDIRYSVQARVLEKPEFMSDVSEDEMADFTEALIPIKVRGTLASPSFSPDIEAMFRKEVEDALEKKTEEIKKDLFNRLLGNDSADDSATEDGAEGEPKKEEKIEDQLKDSLKGLFKN